MGRYQGRPTRVRKARPADMLPGCSPGSDLIIVIITIIIVIIIIVISIIINSIITITTMVCSLFNYVLSRSISSISHSILQLPINRQHTLLVNSITLFSIFVTYAAYNSPDTATHLSISIDVTTKNLGSERFQRRDCTDSGCKRNSYLSCVPAK